MPNKVIEEEYVRVALAIGEHLPGYIDSYFGPPEWKEQAASAGPLPLPELAGRISALSNALANASDIDSVRKTFLARQVLAMRISVRLLRGEKLSLEDEVQGLYDVLPAWIEESVFEETQRQLDALLPPGGSLLERMTLHRKSLQISVEQAKALLPVIVGHMRDITRKHFPLPEDESLEFTWVKDKPWMAYNRYLGNCRSGIEVNTDLPFTVTALIEYAAHEAYPGHHTELCIKEKQLVQQGGYIADCLALLNAPNCVMSEGLATVARDTVLPADALAAWLAAEILPRVGLAHMDAKRITLIDRAHETLSGAVSNAMFLIRDRGAGAEEVISYLQRYALSSPEEARKRLEFLLDPQAGSYIFTYTCGRQLLMTLFERKGDAVHWYGRLLAEAVVPSQVRQWILT